MQIALSRNWNFFLNIGIYVTLILSTYSYFFRRDQTRSLIVRYFGRNGVFRSLKTLLLRRAASLLKRKKLRAKGPTAGGKSQEAP